MADKDFIMVLSLFVLVLSVAPHSPCGTSPESGCSTTTWDVLPTRSLIGDPATGMA